MKANEKQQDNQSGNKNIGYNPHTTIGQTNCSTSNNTVNYKNITSKNSVSYNNKTTNFNKNSDLQNNNTYQALNNNNFYSTDTKEINILNSTVLPQHTPQ